jgi:predicted metalloenzyme YecM
MRKLLPHFTKLSHKWHDFRKSERKMCIFIFSTKFVWNISRYNMNFSYNKEYKNTRHIRVNRLTETFKTAHINLKALQQLRKYMHSTAILGRSIIVEKLPKPWLNMSKWSRVTKCKGIQNPHPKTENIYWRKICFTLRYFFLKICPVT